MSMEEWTGQKVPEHIIHQASEWIACLDADPADTKNRQAFEHWLCANPLHQSAFEEMSLLWAKTSVIKSLSQHVHRSSVVSIDTACDFRSAFSRELILTPLIQEPAQQTQISFPNTLYPIAIVCITLGMLVPAISQLF